ncbi:MAG: hypothetical protein ACI857_001954 [Arenicella sp.]|jgi:hypothetical protein
MIKKGRADSIVTEKYGSLFCEKYLYNDPREFRMHYCDRGDTLICSEWKYTYFLYLGQYRIEFDEIAFHGSDSIENVNELQTTLVKGRKGIDLITQAELVLMAKEKIGINAEKIKLALHCCPGGDFHPPEYKNRILLTIQGQSKSWFRGEYHHINYTPSLLVDLLTKEIVERKKARKTKHHNIICY